MTSFRRIKPSSLPSPPPGTIVCPTVPLPHLSTGLASLDDVLSPGQPLSSALLVLTPDAHSAWGKLIQRYWIAQGLISQQNVVVVGAQDEPDELVKGCMWDASAAQQQQQQKENKEQGEPKAENEDAGMESEGEELLDENEEGNKIKIAWRYGGMSKFQTTVDTKSSSVNSFNYTLSLTQNIPRSRIADLIDSRQLAYVHVDPYTPRPSRKKGETVGVESPLDEVLNQIKKIVEKGPYQRSTIEPRPSQPARALRIALPNLFSQSYGDLTHAEMFRFLMGLRSVIRPVHVAVLITLPPHLCADKALVSRLMWATDSTIELEGFGSDPTLPELFSHHHGFLHVHAPFHQQSLAPPSQKTSTLLGGRGGSNNLAFKLKRKAFVVETLHLDVEGGVGERRTTAPPSVTASLKGMKDLSISNGSGGGEGHDHHTHSHDHDHSHNCGDKEEKGAGRVRIEVSDEVEFPTVKREPVLDKKSSLSSDNVKPRKSAMKRVGFVDPSKPEIYEF